MAQLYISNVNFESTGNNQLVYSANTITLRLGGVNVFTMNSTSVANGSGVTFPQASYTTTSNATATVNNSLTVTGAVIIGGNVTPTAVAANTADWTPGLGNTYNIRVSANTNVANSEYLITGMTAGTNGQVVILNNIGPKSIWIRNEEAGSNGAIIPGVNVPGSTAVNRFNLPNHFQLQGYQSASFYYDGTLARWRLTNSSNILFDYKSLLTKAFFGGGSQTPLTPTTVATADRTTYSSETTAAVPGANLSQARFALGAAGNSSKGFFMGGYSPNLATADRTTYSTETTAAVLGANLSQARTSAKGAGNACKGFFSGGGPGCATTNVTVADRTTYSTETTAAVPGANLSQGRKNHGAAGNSCKGFFIGGTTPAAVATADRTTYSTETTAAVSGANLSQARGVTASGNQCKGFFSGGFVSPAYVTTTDKTNYSTETTAAVSGANLSQARSDLAAAGNACKGFFSGGLNSAPAGQLATANRTTYSTETTAAVPGANLSGIRSNLAAI